ncbi:MAG: hypothetical protein LBV16_08195 [Elusimicrobiota bacterium]|nr:hypothetical protein [Elusimicrobiota bacterium]
MFLSRKLIQSAHSKTNISKFKCSKDLDVELFLRNKTFDYDVCDRARTYLYRDNDGGVSAYFSVTSGILELLMRFQ